MNQPILRPYTRKMKSAGNRIIFLLMSFAIIVSFNQCIQQRAIVKTINPGEGTAMINNSGNHSQLVILDVRTPAEFAEGHIANATNIDVNAGDFVQKISKLDKTKKYLVYCRSGHRSANAAGIMKDHSFKKIYNLDGGITRWINEKNPVVK